MPDQPEQSAIPKAETPPRDPHRLPRMWLAIIAFQAFLLAGVLLFKLVSASGPSAPHPALQPTGQFGYRKVQDPSGPWTFHIVEVPRNSPDFQIRSLHAEGKSVGLAPLTSQLQNAAPDGLAVVAAINGDYYVREGPYGGDPRGLQIVDGVMISAPSGTASFWIDAENAFQAGVPRAQMQVNWPDGSHDAIGLNQPRKSDGLVLFTPDLGESTHTRGGRELVLERSSEDAAWLPLKPGEHYRARVKEVRNEGNSTIATNQLVLSAGPARVKKMPALEAGAELQLVLETVPSLRGASVALSGGPLLVHGGKQQKIVIPESDSYEFTTMQERHPRSAIGWNAHSFFMVAVDGRQPGVSEGMTLDEWAQWLLQLGCTEALNLDGGGSSTLWHEGEIKNRPCDGYEREIANVLAVYRRIPKTKDSAEVGR